MNWLRRRIWEPLVALLKTGLSPRSLAWSVAVGLALGVFPMLGATTLLCVGAGLVFRLSQPAIQVVNYLVYPLQLALLVPFIRMGDWLFGVQPLPLSLSAILASLKADTLGTIVTFWTKIWHACVVWALLALPLMILLALALRPVFETVARSLQEESA